MSGATVQQMADYYARQSLLGRGQWAAQISVRGQDAVNLSIPAAGDQSDASFKRVFVTVQSGG